jgi:hypothetical protein
VICADRLQRVADVEQQGREVRKAINHEGESSYLSNTDFFSGVDASERLVATADALRCVVSTRP